jgi:hypothetical protein
MNRDEVLDELIAGNDLDELIREVDRRTDSRDWDGLVRLRDRCRAALERGFQLWPASSLAEYRLALRAPAPFAAAVLSEGAGRFALGPLPEVAASTHTWDELAPYLTPSPTAGIVAHERVVRGDDLRGADVPFADVFDLPLAVAEWEPEWPLAEYRDSELHEPRPNVPALLAVSLPGRPEPIPGGEVAYTLAAVVEPWVAQSNGTVDVVAVRGAALDALAALGLHDARVAELTTPDALAQLGWAGASGGAHGRRRGTAAGRDLALSVYRELASTARWFAFDDGAPPTGWHLALAVEDPDQNTAWAINARDHR